MLSSFKLFSIILSLLPLAAGADDVLTRPVTVAPGAAECPRVLAEEPLATQYASASIMKNLAETDDSIRAVASRLLEQALRDESREPAAGCSEDCPDQGVAEVIYRVQPMAFLPHAEQNDVCLRFEEQTATAPLRFTPDRFTSFNTLNAWLTDFSQGRGEDGKRLYEQCSSNCSPRYTFVIAGREGSYAVQAEVLCGLARNREVDSYLISTALRRACALN